MCYSNLYPKILKNHSPAKLSGMELPQDFRNTKQPLKVSMSNPIPYSYLMKDSMSSRNNRLSPTTKAYKITRPHLEEAKVHLFVAIQHSTKKSATVKKYFNKYCQETDGIKV